MRIVHLADRIPPYHLGGAEKVAWRVACGLREQGHEVYVITATDKASYDEIRENIPIYYLHSRYPNRLRAWLSLYNPQTVPAVRRLLNKLQPDVVNVHNVHRDLSYASMVVDFPVVFCSYDPMPVSYGKLIHFINGTTCEKITDEQYRVPFGYHLRKMRFRYNPFRNIIIRHILRNHVEERIAVSIEHRRALEANNLPPFRVVYFGFDVGEYTKPPQSIVDDLRQRLGLDGRCVVFFGGRLREFKGGRQLLEAVNEIAPQLPNVLLLLASAAPFERELLDGLDNITEAHICESGWLSGDELLAAYHLADVVAVPSTCLDPLPTIIFESMAVAKPVIATCFGGSPELVIDGVTGYVVNPYDTPTFADRLLRLLRDETLRRQMGEAGQHRLSSGFTFGMQIKNMLSVYKDAVARYANANR